MSQCAVDNGGAAPFRSKPPGGETWAETNMTPIRGWAPRGERLVARAPLRKWRTLRFLVALGLDRIDAPILLDGPINGMKFRAYIELALVPTLASGDVVIIDNLGSHKSIRKPDLPLDVGPSLAQRG